MPLQLAFNMRAFLIVSYSFERFQSISELLPLLIYNNDELLHIFLIWHVIRLNPSNDGPDADISFSGEVLMNYKICYVDDAPCAREVLCLQLTDEAVVETLLIYFKSLFPKTCNNCLRIFATLSDYLKGTQRLSPSISYDADLSHWNTKQPIGSSVMANCSCGSTLALTTKLMPLAQQLELLNWLSIETQKRGLSASELLEQLRDDVRTKVLGDKIIRCQSNRKTS
jgi:hypothetical protein